MIPELLRGRFPLPEAQGHKNWSVWGNALSRSRWDSEPSRLRYTLGRVGGHYVAESHGFVR